MATKHGGFAFPHYYRDSTPPYMTEVWRESQGMTLRDYFAAQALVATGPLFAFAVARGVTPQFSEAARDCYRLADAMLAEREK